MYRRNALSIFSGSYGQMYAVPYLVWQNYANRQKDFAKRNTKYTLELAEAQQKAIDTARDMPNVSVRRDFAKEARLTLSNAALNCTENWQCLSSLIEKSFPKEQWSVKKGQAGYANYAPATREQWNKVMELTAAAVQFINDNMEALTAGGMLPGFPAETEGYKETYDGLCTSFYAAKQAFEAQTTAKVEASNAIYTDAMAMMEDGKKIYKNNPRVASEFVYSALMKKVRGKGFIKTGITFILRGADKMPLTTPATVVLSNGQKESNSDQNTIRFEAPEGEYGFTLTATGYPTVTGTVKINPGTMHQKTVNLQLSSDKSINL